MLQTSPRAFTLSGLLALLTAGVGLSVTTPVVRAQNDEVVATVNGRALTRQEVDASIVSQLLPLQQQIYALRKAALDNLILTVLLEEEARKRGVPVEELRRQLTAGKVEVSPSEVEKEYLDNIAVFGAMSPEEAKERIRLAFESNARMQLYREALAKLKEGARVELKLEEPRLPPLAKDDAAPSRGVKAAAVTIIEFSDFQCPFCRDSQGVIRQVLQAYQNDIRLVFRHLPLATHPEAFSAAQAAVCAGEQGLFWPYHDALFAAETLSPDTFSQIAADVGLNLPAFKTCLNSEASRMAVLKDVREAKRLGITGTPAFIINDRLVRGAQSFAEFKAIIEQELKSARAGPRAP
ncbi:MAG TPA: thioredoxin domain-containing protein [Pyrinomonadaceae bacterium]|jgi:protein-disulfide isomerase